MKTYQVTGSDFTNQKDELQTIFVGKNKGLAKSCAKDHRYAFNIVTLITWKKGLVVKEEILYAGLARPEAIYVIVKTGDKLVLHRGAVLSSREFRRPVTEPLDDDTWKKEVKKGAIPSPPSFTASFRKTITEDEIVEIIKSRLSWAMKPRLISLGHAASHSPWLVQPPNPSASMAATILRARW